MNKFFEKFQNGLLKIADVFSTNKVINSITSAFVMVMPFMIVGSIFGLLQGLSAWGWQDFITSKGIKPYLALPYELTMSIISLYIVFCVGYQFAVKKGIKKYAINIGLISLLAFFIITPLEENSIPMTWLGSTGMFMGVIVALIVGLIFYLADKHNWVIKMPEQVPPMISKQFSALIPQFIVIVLFLCIKLLFAKTPAGDAQNALYSVLSGPLKLLSGNAAGGYVVWAICFLAWFVGINGGMVIGPFYVLIFLNLQMQNLAAYSAGQPVPNIVTGNAIAMGAEISCSLPCIIAMLIFSKSKANRSISKIAIIPSMFGIDEPAYFGYPMIMNPIFFIPWVVLVPILSWWGTYLLNITHILPYASGASTASLFVPFFVKNFMVYGWKGVVWGFIFLVISVFIYAPFVKLYDKQCIAKELAQVSNASDSEEK